MQRMPVLLLSNDDGISAPGIGHLEQALAGLGEIWVVAPDVERSATGRAVSLHRPLRVCERSPRHLAVDGTPADCILLATRSLLPALPDLVVSGVNNGYNIGEDLDYSGTVGAAAEGALQGARSSMAVSASADSDDEALMRAAALSRALAEILLLHPLPRASYLNINMPPAPTSRLRWTRPGSYLGPGDVERRVDPRGREYYWIGNRPEEAEPPPDTDRGALAAGCISASLLTLERSYRDPWSPPELERVGLEVV